MISSVSKGLGKFALYKICPCRVTLLSKQDITVVKPVFPNELNIENINYPIKFTFIVDWVLDSIVQMKWCLIGA